ncbi:hypothetical protein [Nocardia vinacea]|uniref:hypothetical protein n=1 Tax=Nocardia vinacea TaxID=96468 RepID=UPI0002E71D12|nr:hypothetical protein [Nocardia vinacea]
MHSISRITAIATLAVLTTASAVSIASAAPVEAPASVTQSAIGDPGRAVPDISAADPNPVPAQVDPQAEYDQAIGAMAGAFSNANHDGSLVGTAIGVVIGCPLGALTGGTLTALVSAGMLTPVGVVGGCILGGTTLGGLGGIFAGAITGFPALADAAGQQYNRLHAQGLIAAPLNTDNR